MKVRRIMFAGLIVFLFASSLAFAGDFDWMNDLNIRAEADPSGFRMQLATRFKIGNAEINTVINSVEKPADAYMMFRLGEMSHQPTDYVVRQYRSTRGRGWGVLAKSLGIKPGSKEFHALKNGYDLYGANNSGMGKGHGHGNGHGKGRGND